VKYASAFDFRKALTARALQQGYDHQRWFRMVSFERFLARVFAEPKPHWVLKGGYALELRLKSKARSTLDLDLSVPPPLLEDLLELLQEAAERDLGDFFEFRISKNNPLQGAPEGGLRFSIEARLDGKPLSIFHVDIGQGDTHSTPLELLPSKVDFTFAGLENPQFPSYPMRDHFAEKLHAYTRPRERKTRVKDLLDLALLLELGVQNDAALLERIRVVFATYATHELPEVLPDPPEDWLIPFADLATKLDLDPPDAYVWLARVQTFIQTKV
jgi:predicted nucleotidyltransferase component of viral defense system